MRLERDELVTPNLRLVRPLGEGGMGSVWLARHLTLAADVAVKFISERRTSGDPDVVTRFEREAQAVAKIDSAHVVRVLDRGVTDDDTPFIVMELLKGHTLAQRLAREGQLDVDDAAIVVEHVSKGLAAAHKVKIVHRDIKPSNIFVTRVDDELQVKLLDFGIAKQTGDDLPYDLTRTGSLVGSPQYMSPEQLLSAKAVDHRADLWALAVVAYEMLTGKPPFAGETVTALSMAICNGTHEPPRALNPTLAPQLDHFFQRAFTSDASRRFRSARALARAFHAAAQGLDPIADGDADAAPEDSPSYEQMDAESPADAPSTLDASHLTEDEPKATFDGASRDTVLTPPHNARRWALLAAAIVVAGALAWGLPRLDRDDAAATPAAAPAASSTGAPKTETSSVSPPPTPRVPEGMETIAGGRYWIGCDEAKNRSCFDDEKPGHHVEVRAFAIDRFEVTVADYARCVEQGACTAAGRGAGCNAGQPDRERHPINCVSWHDARTYCARSDKRLPTETEWEVAARGRDRRSFPWGDDAPDCQRAVLGGAACGRTTTQPVGDAPADVSPFGVRDMAGNVREWTASDYLPYPGAQAPTTAAGKVNRGASFLIRLPAADRAHTRISDAPDERRPELGFRCAANAD